MKKILITGGPVHAYLDVVKIITNKFRGGLIAQMAVDFLSRKDRGLCDVHITYLCTKQSKQPLLDGTVYSGENPALNIVYHDGIDDYMDKVLELAPKMDAVILGAAVANLIPKNKIEGKFPSHNYKEGDTIPIDFTIAPRIIDRVKEVAPKTQLFGFKLLAGVGYDELISAAYGVLLESKATAVIANDAMDLMHKYVVTKERAVHPMLNKELAEWILDRLKEEYYRTEFKILSFENITNPRNIQKLADLHKDRFTSIPEGFVFGSLAVRDGLGFVTTSRGKNELASFVNVWEVDHEKRIVYVAEDAKEGNIKATLNAPLLDKIFTNKKVHSIVHYHKEIGGLRTYEYATPGTTTDTNRPEVLNGKSFNIRDHGCYVLYNKEGDNL
ncbi:hypothetical protein LCGC14_1415080 [marine sediment metagenome]|uniref:DNA/pantothenate metabolism flavoprotein C-terminal domain-containing protein n=1 Tax=marine sediment metagenome TaxID=412755 RepID=A0A0F9JTF8_9ZZZZ